ncbi:phage tail tape measure protein [Agrobacterium rosae]|uniref:phage tail tape measure protein n=1 Tax=Agrobacterium rosae TaxID=1972867 RepID=UPI002033E86E|nr:phage tail tape measure protein [Agrobacterium rosae]MCM2435366.1 phage tail tape measure protein [Agrobacterium rosae]
MVSRTAVLRLQLVDSVSGPSRGVAASLKGIDGALGRLGKSGTPEVKRLVKQLEYLQKKATAIGDFRETRRGLKDTAVQLRTARANVQGLEKALSSVAKPTKKMEADLRTARATLKSTTEAFKQQGAAVKASERSLRSFGVAGRSGVAASQKQIRSELAATIVKMRQLDREARKRPPRPVRPSGGGSVGADLGGAVVGGALANAGQSAAKKAFGYAVNFDREAAFQSALGGFNPDERKTLNRQAEKIGGDTRFSNVDVVQAQTTVLQRGIRDTKTIMSLTDKITDYALAMGVTLEEGAEAVTGSALSKRIDIKDTKAVSNFVDFMVWMAKNGGMSNEDVSQFVKYGGAPTTGAKLPDEYMAAMGMILRRSGVRGDEAGVFARSAASKLVAPTKKGRDSLAAMGIDYNKFTSIDTMNADGLGILMKNNFGQRLTPEMRKEVADLIDNGEFVNPDTGESQSVISDSGEFVTQMGDILAPLFADSKGKVSVQDSKALAKELAAYQKYSIESVDATGLLNAIASSDPTLGNLNAFFTDKQGGRANMIFQQWPLFQELLKKMQNVPAGVANDIGTKANEGLYGDYTKLTGTIETALTRVGQDWEFATRPLINQTNAVIDGFIGLSDGTRRLIEAIGGGIALLAGFAAFKGATGLIGRVTGGGGAAAGAATGGVASRIGGLMSRTPGLLALTALLSQQGSTADNAYVNASPEDRQKMRDEARATAARLNAEKDAANARSASAASARNAGAAPLQASIAESTVSWPFAAQQGMREYVAALTTGGAQAEAEANRIGSEIETQLNVVGNPDVNTGRLERALGLARSLAAVLRGETSGLPVSSGATAPASGGVGHPRRRGGPVRAGVTYPVGGKGTELYTPGADGFITPGGGGDSGARAAPQINNTFIIKGDNAKSQAQEIAQIISSQLRRSEQTVFSGTAYGD